MGFFDKVKALAADAPTATFGPFMLRPTAVEKTVGKDKGRQPLEGVTAVVETGQELERRVTITRAVALGALAWRFKKKSGGTYFLTIEGPGFAWVEEVDRKKQADARKFAAAVRAAATAPAD